MYKNFNAHITKMLEKNKIKEESNQRYLLKKLLQDFETLEKFYSDKEYRNNLISQARYHSLEYVQLENIYEQDRRLKEKLANNMKDHAMTEFMMGGML